MATYVDAVGSGMWIPFVLLYLVVGKGLPALQTGAALTLGGTVGLLSIFIVGSIVDRFGFISSILISNLSRFALFLLYPLVTEAWQVVMLAALVSAADRLFWTVNAPLVNSISNQSKKAETILGAQTVARFVGAGLGAGAAAVLPLIGGVRMYDALAILNALSFAIAGSLVAGLMEPTKEPRSQDAPQSGWRGIIANRSYAGFCAMHLLFTFASSSKFIILPLVVIDSLSGPVWLPSIAIIIATTVIIVGQLPLIRFFSRWPRQNALYFGAAMYFIAYSNLVFLSLSSEFMVIFLVVAFGVLVSLGEAVFSPTATAAAAEAASSLSQGRASALFQMTWGIAQVGAPLALTFLLMFGDVVLWVVLASCSALIIPSVASVSRWLPNHVLLRKH